MGIGFVLLKIFFSIILFILILFLVLILFILLSPIKYELKCIKKENIFVDFKLNCFFGIVKLFIIYKDNEVKHKISIFPLTLLKKKKKSSNKEYVEIVKSESSFVKVDDTNFENIKDEEEKEESNTKKEGGFKESFEKIKYYHKQFIEFPDKKEILKHTIVLLKELLKTLKPKKYNIGVIFGFDDPSTTGYVLGVISAIRPFTGLKLNLVADFEKEIFVPKIYIKDSFNLLVMTIPVLKYALRKPVRKLIFRILLKQERCEDNE